jgi:membrane protein YdbS with pleckstrin-like domain/ribosomal protein L40E
MENAGVMVDNRLDMFCEKCGAENSDTASFCRKCGREIADEIATRVAVRDAGTPARRVENSAGRAPETADGEAQIFSISPTLLFVKIGYVLAAITALLLVGVISAFQILAAWIAIILGLLIFLIPAFYHFKQKLVRYTLTASKLEVDEGFIARTTRSIPLGRIQDVTVSSSVVQRLLGFGNLMIDNASDEGGKVTLKNINSPRAHADLILKEMKRLNG